MKRLLVVLVLAGIAGAGLVMLRAGKGETGNAGSIMTGDVTVRIKEDGFSPDQLRIKKGTKVRFINDDSIGHWPASDLHPSHTLYPEFDPKQMIPPKGQWSFVFENIGEWGMHDHLSPYIIGKITVVE